MYGDPALAGRVLSLEGSSKPWESHDETASGRLKPGLHAPQENHVCYRTACGCLTDYAARIGRGANKEEQTCLLSLFFFTILIDQIVILCPDDRL